jgi:hypothetical protein
MASGAHSVSFADPASLPMAADDDTALLRLCAAFIADAQARSVEGARLDAMAWSSAVDCGYSELTRSTPAHQDMLAEILASLPVTVAGLLAKAHAIQVHGRDPESEVVSYAQLADDVIRLFNGSPEAREPRARIEPSRPHLVPASRRPSAEP